ncbi:MAG: hypothetical protein M1361_01410 [Patescibacteria group bacterium]|nr:hypothetical protein [Patescibacteria group bacterium]MCL5224257.1 hypothetical protein [Patescibacteria group bacterium]
MNLDQERKISAVWVLVFVLVVVILVAIFASLNNTNYVSSGYSPVCDIGTSTSQIVTAPRDQVYECLAENGNLYTKDTQGNVYKVWPISSKLDTLSVDTLQSVYYRITGKKDVHNDASTIAEDILAAAYNAPHGANIPEINVDITGTWPNLSASYVYGPSNAVLLYSSK